MKSIKEEERRVKTADRVFDIFEFIKEQDGAGVTEIATHLDLAKSTVHQYLYTLKDRGYIVKNRDYYDISLRFKQYGDYTEERYEIISVAEPTLQQLASKTGEVVWLLVEEHGYAVYLRNVLGEQAIQTHAKVGKHEFMHCLAAGKAILAHMPEDRVYAIIEQHGLPKRTEQTITDTEVLLEMLYSIRKQGYAVNDEEATSQIKAVAAPVVDENDTVIGAVCVSGPTRRIKKKESEMDLPELIKEATDEIELKLTWEEN